MTGSEEVRINHALITFTGALIDTLKLPSDAIPDTFSAFSTHENSCEIRGTCVIKMILIERLAVRKTQTSTTNIDKTD